MDNQPQKTNRQLSRKARFLGFINQELVLPLLFSLGLWGSLGAYGVLDPVTAFSCFLLTVTLYWIVIGQRGWRMYSRLLSVPQDIFVPQKYEDDPNIPLEK